MSSTIWRFGAGLTAAAALLTASASAQFITDDFETDTSANYTIVDPEPIDATASFAFDYVAAGIPLAPNSQAGDKGGLRFTANDTDPPAADTITAYHNTALSGFTNYSLTVDFYMGVTGTSGTTEHMHVGVAGDGTTLNSLFNPISGSGHFIAITGEGGSASDYRHSTPSTLAVPSGDPTYLNSDNTTNASGDTYQSIFPDTEFPGSPGNTWATLKIEIAGGLVTYSINGTPIIQTAAEATDGQISLGHGDLFSSVASPAQSQFVVYDNLVVTPEPGTLALLGLGLLALRRR
jgi:hypothetical protein